MPPTQKPSATVPKDRARFFYTGAAAALLVLMLLGFQQFYLHGRAYPNRPLTPAIRNLIIAHGIAMSAWLVLLLIQPLLIVNGKYKVHMLLGRVGAVLAACIFVLGLRMAVGGERVSPPELRLWSLPYKQFMAVPVISVTLFAGFVAVGVWYRKRPEIHRPMMLLATLAAIVAALDRIDWITSLYRSTIWGTIFGPFFSALVIGAGFFAVKWALTRNFDRYFALGWCGLVLASAGTMALATSDIWDTIASFLLQY